MAKQKDTTSQKKGETLKLDLTILEQDITTLKVVLGETEKYFV